MRDILGAFTQARELWSTFENIEELPAPKRSDQRKRQVRPVLATPAARRRKYAIETGYDTRTGRFLKAPLEPWACDNQQGAWLLYREIIDAPNGSLHVSQYHGKDLGHLTYMAKEHLIGFDARSWIYPLGDPLPAADRSRYPGAAVPDSRAATGKQLRGHAKDLVVGALIRLRDQASLLKLSRAQRRELAEWRDRGGVPFAIRVICHEANLIRRHYRPDLAGHRWLSVSTCGRVLRLLRATGVLTLLQPARRYRANRQWQCSPAVCAVAGGTPERKKRRERAVPAAP